jgi:hypothetical protein
LESLEESSMRGSAGVSFKLAMEAAILEGRKESSKSESAGVFFKRAMDAAEATIFIVGAALCIVGVLLFLCAVMALALCVCGVIVATVCAIAFPMIRSGDLGMQILGAGILFYTFAEVFLALFGKAKPAHSHNWVIPVSGAAAAASLT